MLKTKEKIIDWLDKYKIKNYTINEDLTVDVDGHVKLRNKELKSIDVKFNKVSGYFSCSWNKLTSLKGCPEEVLGGFNCSNNELTSLEGCPQIVNGDLSCNGNNLINLNGIPKKVGGDFECNKNPNLGELQDIFDFNEIKRILEITKNKTELDLLLINKNQEIISKIKI